MPDTSLSDLIVAAMARHPQAIAVEFDDRCLSYAGLDAATSALARDLVARGAGRDRVIAVALPRSLELVIALVAILRAGSAYLPLDPAHPDERLARVLALSKPVLVLADPAQAARLPAGLPCLVPAQWSAPEPASVAQDPVVVTPTQAAYLIYTSGSTGEPKGVLVEHRAIVNRLEWMRQHYGFEAGERILQKTPATFDVSVWEFFLPLICGATLVVAPPEAHRDPAWLARLLRERRIDTCHFVPSMLTAFLDEPRSRGLVMKRIFCSGEELPATLRDRLHATLTSDLHNLYGPTEAAVDVSYWPAGRDDRSRPIPIGRPVWNTRLYVLDQRLRPLPAGVPGELYLGGVQLARGYLGRDDLTAERFGPDPFVAGERIYRTGDLARWRDDGTVVFLGRNDHQVKLRGQRIERGEIEAALIATGALVRAEVLLREERPGDQPRDGFDAEPLRRHLAARLPDYMVPAAIVRLDAWPVNANGKLDRGALPAPSALPSTGRPARGETEIALARLICEVLGRDPGVLPGADDDFFDLGGDSLAAVTLLLRIQERWHRDPGLGTLFDSPTVAALASAIDAGTVRFDSGLAPLIRLAAGDPAEAPLFVIHPAGGICWGYRHLARALARPGLGEEPGQAVREAEPQLRGQREQPEQPEQRKQQKQRARSVFGLQAPGLAPDHPLPDSIDALAADYVQRVLEVQPQGPIHLLGWSVGGIIAQAMAVTLADRGHEVGLVALLDAYPADVWRDEPDPTPIQALRALLAVTGHDPDGHPELTTREAVIDFVRRGDTALGRLPPEALEGVVRVVTDTNRLIRSHHHRRFDGTLLHVRAGLDHANRPQLRAESWLPHARQLVTMSVPLLHAAMTGPQASALIAPVLIELLSARSAAPAHPVPESP